MTALLVRLTGAAARGAESARSRLVRDEGQALVEYALILFFIAIVCVAVLTVLGTRVSDVLVNIANAF